MTVNPQLITRLPPLPTVKDILRIYHLRARKQLSQNFIMDPKLCAKVTRSAGNLKDSYVCEIGPGPGNLTRPILEAGPKQVVVIEKDQRFIPSLELLTDASNGKLKVIIGDCLEENMENLFPREISQPWESDSPPLHIIGNLPFSISTPLIIRYLRQISTRRGPFIYGRTRLTLTFQKEVADRIVAQIMTSERSRLSIMCQYLCHVERKATLSGSAFVPKPKVDVGIVRFTPRIEPLIKLPFDQVERVVRHIYHYRQKYIKNGIDILFPKGRMDLQDQMIKKSEVNPKSRSFELSVEEVERLCSAYNDICLENDNLKDYNYRSRNQEVENSV